MRTRAVKTERVFTSEILDFDGNRYPLNVAVSAARTMTREENKAGLSSAITLAAELRTDIIAHLTNATRHPTGLQATGSLPAAPTNIVDLLAFTGAALTLYAAHNADAILASGWAYHTTQATTKALTSAVTPTTLVQAVTRLNDLKAKYNDHEDETVGHDGTSSVTADQTAASDAAYGTTNRVPNAALKAGDLVFWSILDDGTGNVTGASATAGAGFIDFAFSADPQNDAVVSYLAVRP